jgi:transcriptional regulator with XRE-family HTH domain/tetratricopeptide (TPR) repeat protein
VTPVDPLDPALLDRADVRAALAARDVGTVYRLLGKAGVSQRRIAELTHQSQSEVSEIRKGRQVRDVWVLERIADGLRVPRAWMRLGYGEDEPGAPSAEEKVDEEMKRRALIAATTGVALGQAVSGLGELTEVALPSREPLPARLGMVHVHTVGAITERLRGVARQFGGQADLFSTAAQRFTRWMQVPATEAIKARLAAALAELHTEAGWCCHDSGLDGTGHFTRAMRLAGMAKDAYGIANAAWHAGLTLIHNGHPNDALKLFQLGQIRLGWCAPGTSTPATRHADDPRLPPLAARLNRQSATAYALLNKPDQAQRYLTEAHEGWTPPDAFERAGEYLTTAVTQLDLHRLDAAEQFAASAVRTYGEGHRRDRIWAETVLAEVHVRAGEPRGLTMAQHAISEVSTLQSAAARQRLVPLATALEARPNSDTQELAQVARKITATRT